MKAIAARLGKAYPETNKGETIVVTPLLENLVGKYRTNLGLLLGAVGLVLLIACANLANLFAARGAARSREFAIHAAVGASRGQIVKQLLVESFVDRDSRRSARIFHCGLGSRDALSLLASAKCFSDFRTSHSICRCLGIHVFVRIAHDRAFRLWPAWQSFARRRSARFESRVARKRRSAISQTHARLARHQRDCAHAHVACCGGAGV